MWLLSRASQFARAPRLLGTKVLERIAGFAEKLSASGITMGEQESSHSQSAAQKSYGFARVASSSEQYIPADAVS